MNKLIYLIVTLLFFSSNLFAEKVSSVKISGNQRVSDETIKIYGEIEINKNYEESDINKVLNETTLPNISDRWKEQKTAY